MRISVKVEAIVYLTDYTNRTATHYLDLIIALLPIWRLKWTTDLADATGSHGSDPRRSVASVSSVV
jgi:hypothetical protein